MSAERRPGRPVCQPQQARACCCSRPLPYRDDEPWGGERYCAKCGRELPGTALRRRLQQVVFEAAHPGDQALRADVAVDLTTSAPALATDRRSPAAGAQSPTGRDAAHPRGGPAQPKPTIEGGHRAKQQLIH